jgi:wyosine [tRNA(Phe)-imidazoG37] synthetase (radical SAM superfamily)
MNKIHIDKYIKLIKTINIDTNNIKSIARFENKIFPNCCLLNSIMYVLENEHNIKIKECGDNIDQSILLYYYLYDRNLGLEELGTQQNDDILIYISKLFNIDLYLYNINDMIF